MTTTPSIASTSTTRQSNLWPYAALFIGVCGMGLSGIFVKWANAPGAVSGFYRMSAAVLLFGLPFGVEVKRNPIRSWRAVWLAVLAGLFFAGDLGFWNTSVLMTTAANATFLGNTAPLWVSLGALWLFKEKLGRMFWVGLVIALSGAAALLGGDFLAGATVGWGAVLSLIAGFFYACFFLATQRAREGLSAFATWWIAALASSAGLFVAALLLGQPFTGYSLNTYLNFIALALTTQVVGYILVNYALGHLPASIVSPTLLLQPVITTIAGVPLLGEGVTLIQIVGGLLVLAGVWIVNRYGK